uniref:Uncharacterized protein n=1 Tax=Rhizophora mucronata TaxID=61149 RepID=A0A2P2PT45_RHIMU
MVAQRLYSLNLESMNKNYAGISTHKEMPL